MRMEITRTVELILISVLLAGVCGKSVRSKQCSPSVKCGTNQCCLGLNRSSDLPQSSGTCAATGAANYDCYVDNEGILTKNKYAVFNYACPCQEGYSCQGTGVNDANGRKLGKCVTTSTRSVVKNAIPGK